MDIRCFHSKDLNMAEGSMVALCLLLCISISNCLGQVFGGNLC